MPPTSCERPTKSCGAELIARVAKVCYGRGGYNRLTSMRRKRNIIMECCKHPCRDTDVYLYCFDDPDETSENDVHIDIIV